MSVQIGPGLDRPWDPGLQPERTALAWRRYGLASLGLGLAMPRLGWDALHWAAIPASVLIVVSAIVILQRAFHRYRFAYRSLGQDGHQRLPDGRLALLAVGTHLLIGGTALVAWAVTSLR